MQSRGQDCRQNIAAREPGKKNCQQCLETEQRAETEENTNRHAAGYRHGCITNVTVHCLEERDARYRDLIVKFPGESVHPGGGLSSSVGRSWTIRPSLR